MLEDEDDESSVGYSEGELVLYGLDSDEEEYVVYG
jgi:hypothetical protein